MNFKPIIYILLLLGSFLNISASTSIDKKILNIVNPQDQITHKKLLDILFQDEEYFLDESGNVDIVKIVKVLKENGLLKIFYKEPVKLKALFEFELNPIFVMKIVYDTLNKLGYHYILTSSLEKDENLTRWTIEYKSEHAIDPIAIHEELLRHGVYIDDIVKDKNFWSYNLSAVTPTLFESIKINSEDNTMKYTDPRGEFWFNIEENATIAYINSNYPDLWHPYIICYNHNLEILKIYKRERTTKSLKLSLPEGTKYIKVTDIFTPENLKHGIEIRIEGF